MFEWFFNLFHDEEEAEPQALPTPDPQPVQSQNDGVARFLIGFGGSGSFILALYALFMLGNKLFRQLVVKEIGSHCLPPPGLHLLTEKLKFGTLVIGQTVDAVFGNFIQQTVNFLLTYMGYMRCGRTTGFSCRTAAAGIAAGGAVAVKSSACAIGPQPLEKVFQAPYHIFFAENHQV